MAGFGRSNSLSINTGAGAATGGGLFGSSTTANQSATATQPQSSGSLFGAPQPAAPQAQAQAGGSLFGGAGSGLKLSTPGAAAPASGLFGGAGQSKPSLFGTSTQQPAAAAAAAASPSMFGNPPAQPAQAAPSLFGSTQQAQPQPQQQTNSLFGGLASQNRSSTLGGSTLGQPQTNAAAQPVQMTLDSVRGTTRFNDLHPELQTLIQQFDEGIQRKINYCGQIRETLPSSETEIASIAPDVAYIETFLSTVETGLDNDSTSIAYLKDLVKKDAADATLSFRAIENQRLPAQFHYRNSTNLTASSAKTPATAALDDDDPAKPVDLMNYFGRRTDELARTLEIYQHQIREIEAHLRTMEAGTVEKAQQLTGSRSAPRDQRRELVEALKAIEGAILDSAKKVGGVRDEVTKQTLGHVGATLL